MAESVPRSMVGFPAGENMDPISSSEKPAAWPKAISASWSSTPGANRRRRPWRPVEAISPLSS